MTTPCPLPSAAGGGGSGGGEIQVMNNALATGPNSYGAKATGATISILGDANGVEGGIWALNTGEITIGGMLLPMGAETMAPKQKPAAKSPSRAA